MGWIKKYLISKGIASNRIQSKGFDESVPMATNDDEEEGMELNRRTEFRILSNNSDHHNSKLK